MADLPCDVNIQGEFIGTVSVSNGCSIAVEEGGRVEGELKANNIRVNGSVDGALDAAGLASFGSKSVCTGKVTYSRIAIEEGAEVEATMKKVAALA